MAMAPINPKLHMAARDGNRAFSFDIAGRISEQGTCAPRVNGTERTLRLAPVTGAPKFGIGTGPGHWVKKLGPNVTSLESLESV